MIKIMLRLLNSNIVKILRVIWTKLIIMWVFDKKNVYIRGKINLEGIPLIDISKGALLEIGNNVTLNSKNKGYHINMHSPIKLLADRDGAEIRIGENTRIHGTCIHAYKSITIGRNCLIAANCQIFDGNGHDLSFNNTANRINTRGDVKDIIIEDDVWIGANSIILPGVTIGKGSVITANSVVIKEIPSMVIAGGNPVTIIKRYYGDE